MADTRESMIIKAKLAEQIERFEEMVTFMKEAVKQSDFSLTAEDKNSQRNLLSVAYKNVIGAKRSSWRVISALELKLGGEEEKSQITKEYRLKIEKELQDVIDDVIALLDNHILPSLKDVGKDAEKDLADEKTFYYKMKGDYCRYNAEFAVGDKRKEITESASEAYETAKKVAEEHLSSTNPIRLGLILNYSVFFYEIQQSPEKACKIAKEAFDSAIADLDTLSEDSYKDSTLIMQLLRDNLTLWTSDIAESGDDKEDQQ